ncbi:MAG: Ig-like domain-containing protein [Clostridia bacterium]|nr:Ig-like domain-containing protein [Clostridia bacterium]
MRNFKKKICSVICAVALLLTCAVPGLQCFAAEGSTGLTVDGGGMTAGNTSALDADIYGLRSLISLADAVDVSQSSASQSEIDAFQADLAQAKAVEQNSGASAADITSAYNTLAESYSVLCPIVDPTDVYIIRSNYGMVYYDKVSVGLLEDYRNVSSQYEVLAYPYDSLIRSIRWSSSNPLLPISPDGLIIPLENSAQYTVINVVVTTYDGREMTNNIPTNVCFAKVHVDGITLESESIIGYVGESYKLNYSLSPTVAGICTANVKNVVWSINSSDYVSMDSDGTLHFLRASGPDFACAVVSVTAVDGGAHAECAIRVDYNRKALQAKINEANQLDQSLYTAESWQRVATALAHAVDVNGKDFYETSSQQEIDDATSALAAAMQALEPLAAIDSIVITHDGSPAPKYNSVKVGTLANYTKQSYSLGFTVTPSDAAYQSAVWTSSDSNVSVDSSGLVKPTNNSACAAKIMLTLTDYNGRQYSDWVYVSFTKVPVTGVTLNQTSLAMNTGATAPLSCTVDPQGTYGVGAASVKTVLWESSDPAVATVADGTVTAVDAGTAQIICITADGGFTATCSVSVTADKTLLEQVISEANAIDSTLFTSESYAILQQAVQAGNAIIAKTYATISEINEAREAIIAAINAMQFLPADYTAVYEAVNAFEVLNPGLYTPESYAAVQQAVNRVVYGLNCTDQARVDIMAQAINDAIAQLEERSAPKLIAADGSNAVVDEADHVIYGIAPGTANVLSYFTATEGGSLTFTPDADGSGTGSTLTLCDASGTQVSTFTLVIFGDVNGDSWYDGRDSFIVNCLVNGLLSRDQVGEAKYLAADCDHDGDITATDVQILEQAGLLLSQVDQTKPDYAQTNAYAEYLDLIDQNPQAQETPAESADEQVQQGSALQSFLAQLIELIKKVIVSVQSLLQKI